MATPKAEYFSIYRQIVEAGAESTISDLLQLFDFAAEHELDRLGELASYFQQHLINMSPPLSEGDKSTTRVLRLQRSGSPSEELISLQKIGETPSIEFKSTLSFDLRRYLADPGHKPQTYKNDILIFEVLRAICGFLNKEGGTLYIGVRPDGTCCGLSHDMSLMREDKRDFDSWCNHLVDLIKKHFIDGLEILNFLSIDCLAQGDVLVAKISVTKRSKESFVRSNDQQVHCYVRQGVRTQQLGIENIPEFVRSRLSAQEK